MEMCKENSSERERMRSDNNNLFKSAEDGEGLEDNCKLVPDCEAIDKEKGVSMPIVMPRKLFLYSCSDFFKCFGLSFIENWRQALAFFFYIFIALCYVSWIHVTQEVQFSPTMMVMSVLISKLALSIAAYMIFDGSIPVLLKSLSQNRKALVLYCVPATAYGITDSLTVWCLRRIDPSTFSIIYNIRVVFMLLLFQHFMRIKLQKPHWLSLILIVLSCIVKELPNAFRSEGSESLHVSKTTPHIVLLFVVGFMAQISAFAAVFNEKLLKEQQQLSLNVQNIAMYGWAIIATFCFSIIIPAVILGGTAALQDVSSIEMWKLIWTYPIVIAVALSATYGLSASFLIKHLNNVIREIACALQLIGTVPINCFIFGYPLHVTDVISIIGVVTGIAIFNRHPLRKP